MLRSWGEPSASAPLRWRDRDHERSENCQLPEPPPSVILWIRNEDIWIINVIQSPGLLLPVGLLSLVRNVAASSLYWERERRHSKDWHLGCLTHSADGGKLGTVHWLNIHYTESGNTITRNIQPIPHLPVSHSYKMTEYYTQPRIKERILKIKLTNTLWCDEKWKESGMFV